MDKLKLAYAFFEADVEIGAVRWRADPPADVFTHAGWRARYMQKRAGRPVVFYPCCKYGHLAVSVRCAGRSVTFLAHRIIWALARDQYPEADLDHANNDPTDNRLANLRLATRSQNSLNSRRRKEGLKGAYQDAGGRWFSAVWNGKRLVRLGVFPDAAAAHNAWAREKAKLAGDFFNPGYTSVFD